MDVQFGASTWKIHLIRELKLGTLVQIRCQTRLSTSSLLTGLDSMAWCPLSATGEACPLSFFLENTLASTFSHRKSLWLGGTKADCTFLSIWPPVSWHLTDVYMPVLLPRALLLLLVWSCDGAAPVDRGDDIERRRRGWRSPVDELQAMQPLFTVRSTTSLSTHLSPVLGWV